MSSKAGLISLAMFFWAIFAGGCATTPDTIDKQGFQVNAAALTRHYEKWVPGLSKQLDNSGGFIVFPDVSRFGILFGGGTFGRGAVCRSDGTQIGWAAINKGSIGLQAGIEGFKLMAVFENLDAFGKFKNQQLSGSATAVIVVNEGGASGTAPFSNGVAIYESAQKGLMAGVNIGLDYLRYEPLSADDKPVNLRTSNGM